MEMFGLRELGAIWCNRIRPETLVLLLVLALCHAWLPNTSSRLVNNFKQLQSTSFTGNATHSDHFIILNQDDNSVLVGGRNKIYNLSIVDFSERREYRIEWPSSDAHRQLCILKGKTEDDCQNYIRVFYRTFEKLFVCGTNSYKPLCRSYMQVNGGYEMEKEMEGIGVCPYDPEHNSTAVYSDSHLYSATAADFSGGDPLIYRHPQRTELSDLKQLNGPNFVSTMPYENFIFFFFRETAVEYMNCGKVIYSRVARVCKDDKGGPHQSKDRWTSFLKARLNCSVPGEYPFYFDEIQSTSDVISGKYGNESSKIIYGTLTTPTNAIGGSAICAYRMSDILQVFNGSFKDQETINSNWLPVPESRVPTPRPGQCVQDSRILQDKNVNFVKTHSLMESAVPAMFGKPILIRVSLQYRFTTIVVDSQVETVNDEAFDILYVGTDDGKVFKVVNIPDGDSAKAFVISENVVLPNGASIKQLKLAPGYGKVVVVGKDEVRLATLNHCSHIKECSQCIELRDPHCGWDAKQGACISLDVATTRRYLIQDIARGDGNKCWAPPKDNKKLLPKKKPSDLVENEIIANSLDDEGEDNEIDSIGGRPGSDDPNCETDSENGIKGCAVKQRLISYTQGTLHIFVIVATVVGLIIGFMGGYFLSRKFHSHPQYPEAPFIEQHNHLERLSGNQNGFLTPRANKAVNLNVVPNSPPPKKDNLDVSKDLNIASDGTLQKIKKTYI